MVDCDGILIDRKPMKEKCGNCKQPLTLSTYYNTVTKEKTQYGVCLNCDTAIKLKRVFSGNISKR
ncbi:MAG: hypothetical protein ACTSRU_07090 [Candidatus Hodarchaeales archaeon]